MTVVMVKHIYHMNPAQEELRESTSPLAEAIAAHRFVADMKPEHLKKLVDVAMFKTFERDQMVFREGEPANRFYLICRGKIAIESGCKGQRSRRFK